MATGCSGTSGAVGSSAAAAPDAADAGVIAASFWARTPRPTSTPHRNVATSKTALAMNSDTRCLPLNWISRSPSSAMTRCYLFSCDPAAAPGPPAQWPSRFIISIGSGKMMVEFFSDAISVSVWR